jgi:prolyl oligopeptidase
VRAPDHTLTRPSPSVVAQDPDGVDTVQWVEAQNKKTNAYLSTLDSREFLKEKLTEKYNYAKTGATFCKGEGDTKFYYYYKNNGLQNQYALYCSKSVDDDGELFFDPNTLAADGTICRDDPAPNLLRMCKPCSR